MPQAKTSTLITDYTVVIIKHMLSAGSSEPFVGFILLGLVIQYLLHTLSQLPHQGNIIKRLKSLLPVLIPLFISAFRRADELANAMEARCYTGGEGRTKMKPLKYHGRDAVGYLMVAAYLAVVILVGRL